MTLVDDSKMHTLNNYICLHTECLENIARSLYLHKFYSHLCFHYERISVCSQDVRVNTSCVHSNPVGVYHDRSDHIQSSENFINLGIRQYFPNTPYFLDFFSSLELTKAEILNRDRFFFSNHFTLKWY